MKKEEYVTSEDAEHGAEVEYDPDEDMRLRREQDQLRPHENARYEKNWMIF